VADLLSQTLEEEKQTDLKLTEVTQKRKKAAASAGQAGPSLERYILLRAAHLIS
jgi:hypothetical protein